MRTLMTEADHARNTLAREAARARAERFENTPAAGLELLGVEPQTREEIVEAKLARLELLNASIATELKEMTT